MSSERTRKIALVTGGSRGIGKDIALSLARAGTGIIVTYNEGKEDAAAVVAEAEGIGAGSAALQLDIGDAGRIDAFIERLKLVLDQTFGAEKIDFVVNNAGIGRNIPIASLSEKDFDLFNNIHFKGPVFLTQKALTMMNDNGAVVFITAAGDRFVVPQYAVYGSCKGAIEVFSRYVAHEYGGRGIRSNTVAPGGIVTDFNGAAIRNNAQAQDFIKSQTPMGRLGYADDIGSVVAFLCSPDAKWLTGQRLEVAGGYRL